MIALLGRLPHHVLMSEVPCGGCPSMPYQSPQRGKKPWPAISCFSENSRAVCFHVASTCLGSQMTGTYNSRLLKVFSMYFFPLLHIYTHSHTYKYINTCMLHFNFIFWISKYPQNIKSQNLRSHTMIKWDLSEKYVSVPAKKSIWYILTVWKPEIIRLSQSM